jgi:hypothetical protein
MVRMYSMHRGADECIEDFVGKLEENRSLGRPNHRWGIILKWNLEK